MRVNIRDEQDAPEVWDDAGQMSYKLPAHSLSTNTATFSTNRLENCELDKLLNLIFRSTYKQLCSTLLVHIGPKEYLAVLILFEAWGLLQTIQFYCFHIHFIHTIIQLLVQIISSICWCDEQLYRHRPVRHTPQLRLQMPLPWSLHGRRSQDHHAWLQDVWWILSVTANSGRERGG